MSVIKSHNVAHYDWGDRCKSWIFCDSHNLSVKLERMPIGSTESLHFHSQKEQFFFILSGKASFNLDGQTSEMRSHEGIHVLANKNHFIENKGPQELSFLVISSPNIANDRTEK